MCCADEAALCSACDQKVHAANKLAGKHQRVPLISGNASGSASPRVPKCDICQEAYGYFFCLEDRALLCRNCDVGIHTANSYVSAHRRFLLTGVQVGLESSEAITSFDSDQSSSKGRVPESAEKTWHKAIPSMPFSEEAKEAFPSQVGTNGDLATTKSPLPGSPMFGIGSIPDWPLNEFFGFPDLNHSYGFAEHYSSKVDSGKLGSSEGSPPYYCIGEGLDADECLGQVPEIPWTVPEISSPPTASGLHWQRNLYYPSEENTLFVPDISSSQDTQFHARATGPKRRKPC